MLGASLRTTDPIRNSVIEAVEQQARVAKETLKNALDEVSKMVSAASPSPVEVGPKDIQSGVLDILRIANLNETEKLENCLDEKIEDSNLIFKACKKLECSKLQLYTKIENLLDEFKKKLKELAEKHRTLAFSGQHNELEEQAKWVRIDTLDAHVLMAIARKKLERDKGADHVFVGHRQLAKWPGSYALSEAIETSKSREAYENVEAVALRAATNSRQLDNLHLDCSLYAQAKEDADTIQKTIAAQFDLRHLLMWSQTSVILSFVLSFFVTMSGVQKAYAYYKRHCDHLLRALILHDVTPIAMTHKENVDIDIAQLNDLANAGIR
ncbi:unnamed protein product [Heligmosomoides polygyrus]|uniref:BAR domain-containing protein n=1 Tax=Heligmosomoides polygyrus TaxID=6339 RepID=A0A183FYW7_HELPZ|nr:unnamed protein product [Heligmosomoides polygyrus]